MIAQEENEITTRAGKVKSLCGGKSDGYKEMGSGENDRMTNREEKNVCCHGPRVYTAFHFILIDFWVCAELDSSFINMDECISEQHSLQLGFLCALSRIKVELRGWLLCLKASFWNEKVERAHTQGRLLKTKNSHV